MGLNQLGYIEHLEAATKDMACKKDAYCAIKASSERTMKSATPLARSKKRRVWVKMRAIMSMTSKRGCWVEHRSMDGDMLYEPYHDDG